MSTNQDAITASANVPLADPKKSGEQHAHVEDANNEKPLTRNKSIVSVATEREAMEIAKKGGWEIDALINEMEEAVVAENKKSGIFDLTFANPKIFTYLLVAFASMGGLLSGLDQSLISGANLFLPEDLGLSTQQNSLVNSSMPLGALIGAIILSPCNEYFGRRWSIIISTILYTIGAALEAGSIDYGMIVSARLILGAGVGLEGGTVPVYVAETVERRLRGNMVSLYQFNIALGEVLGYAVAAMFVNVKGNWRYILGSSLVFSTIMFFGMLFMPESPRWLMHKGRSVDSFRVWKRIRGLEMFESREEFFVMKITTEHEEEVIAAGRTKRFPWVDLFTVSRDRRAFVYALVMIFLGQFTGVNGILYYLSTLMYDIGFSKIEANYMSLVGGGALLIGTIPAVFLMERCGRRFWANLTLPIFFVGLVLVGVSYLVNNQTAKLGIYFSGLIIYMSAFGSYACLTWVIPSEVFRTHLRSYGMGVSDGWLFLSSFIITYNFSGMQEAFTNTGLSIGFFGGIAVLGYIYQLLFMPETKGMTLEEIDLVFEQPTRKVVAQNLKNVKETIADMAAFRWKKILVDNNKKIAEE